MPAVNGGTAEGFQKVKIIYEFFDTSNLRSLLSRAVSRRERLVPGL